MADKLFKTLSREEIDNALSGASPELTPAEEVVNAGVAEDAIEEQSEVASMEESIVEANDAATEVEGEMSKIEETANDPAVEANPKAAAIAGAIATESLRHIKNKLGLSNDNVTVSFEDLDQNPMSVLQVAHEGFKEVWEKLVAALRAMFQKLMAKLKVWTAKLLTLISNYEKKADKLIEEAKSKPDNSVCEFKSDSDLVKKIVEDFKYMAVFFGIEGAKDLTNPNRMSSTTNLKVDGIATVIASMLGEIKAKSKQKPADFMQGSDSTEGNTNSSNESLPVLSKEGMLDSAAGFFSAITKAVKDGLHISANENSIEYEEDVKKSQFSIPVRPVKGYVLAANMDDKKIFKSKVTVKEDFIKTFKESFNGESIKKTEIISLLDVVKKMAKNHSNFNKAVIGLADMTSTALDTLGKTLGSINTKDLAGDTIGKALANPKDSIAFYIRGTSVFISIAVPEFLFTYMDLMKILTDNLGKMVTELKEPGSNTDNNNKEGDK